MTAEDVIAKWKQASTGILVNGTFHRNGNWEPTERALRRLLKGRAADVAVVRDGPEALLQFTPDKESKRPAFALLVSN